VEDGVKVEAEVKGEVGVGVVESCIIYAFALLGEEEDERMIVGFG
jgi:hypothetical protein